MKTVTSKDLKSIITFFDTSAYALVEDITKLAESCVDDEHGLSECEESIFDDIDASLEGYVYVECEGRTRHIWHRNEE